MKTKEELSTLKEEYENMSKKLAELSEDELKAVIGGYVGGVCGENNSVVTSGEIQSSTTENIQSDWRTNIPGWNQWF